MQNMKRVRTYLDGILTPGSIKVVVCRNLLSFFHIKNTNHVIMA